MATPEQWLSNYRYGRRRLVTSLAFRGTKTVGTSREYIEEITSKVPMTNFHRRTFNVHAKVRCKNPGNAMMKSNDNLLSFTAIRGIQAGREYYTAMCPLKVIPKVFLFDEEELSAELRAQRSLNKTRIPEMAAYIVANPDNYIFSSISVCRCGCRLRAVQRSRSCIECWAADDSDDSSISDQRWATSPGSN
jgi:hypothetical protein